MLKRAIYRNYGLALFLSLVCLFLDLGSSLPAFASTQQARGATIKTGTSVSSPLISRQQAQKVASFWTAARLRKAVNIDTATVRNATPISAKRVAAQPHGKPASIVGTRPLHARTQQTFSSQPGRQSTEPRDLSYPYPYVSYDVDNAQWPYSTIGRLFFNERDSNGNIIGSYACSGTAVVSQNKSTVDTAGHCVYDADNKQWYTDWAFCPAYHNGNCPYGWWYARQAWTRSEWQNHQWEFDLGELDMWYNEHGALTDIVGSAGVAWNFSRDQNFEALGYPAQDPFNGQVLHECDAPYATSEDPDGFLGLFYPYTMGIGCDSTPGVSGGPWFFGFNSGSSGWVNGHFSYSHKNDKPYARYSPYYGDVEHDLYNQASNS